MRLRIEVRGRVQGVGFRWFTRAVAEELGLVGWVRNLPDGSVLCEAQGERAAVERFAARIRQGPAHACVERADVTPLAANQGEVGFDVLR